MLMARLLQSALHGMLQYRDLRHQPYRGDLLFFYAARILRQRRLVGLAGSRMCRDAWS